MGRKDEELSELDAKIRETGKKLADEVAKLQRMIREALEVLDRP